MSDRVYIPECYVDEVCPPGRKHPSDWIGEAKGDRWLLAKAEDDSDWEISLAPGELVPFSWTEGLGEVEIALAEDGTHRVIGGADDPLADSYWLAGDAETMASTLADFVQQIIDMDGFEPGETFSVRMARWSNTEEQWRFQIGPEGPRFVPVEVPHG